MSNSFPLAFVRRVEMNPELYDANSEYFTFLTISISE
jgi:hypothetical protein